MSNLSNHFLISPNAECVVPEINVSSSIKLLHRGWERPPAQNAWTLFIILHQKIVISQKQPSQSANTSSLVWLARQSKDSHVSIRGHLRLWGRQAKASTTRRPLRGLRNVKFKVEGKKSNKMLNNVQPFSTWWLDLKVRLQDKPGLTQYSGSVWWHVGGGEARRPQEV